MTRHYQCPGCGSTVEYDPSVKKLYCPYCGERYTVEEHGRRFANTTAEGSGRMDTVVREKLREKAIVPVKVMQCCSCGAEMTLNNVETSSFCPYCGQATVVTERLQDYLEPEYIIPFKVTREQAESIIRKRLQSGFFIPKGIRNFKTDRLRGIYIPYWLFDVYCSDEQLWRSKEGRNEVFSYCAGDCTFHHLTAEASRRFNDDYSMKLEPYRSEELKKFDAAYLSGFYSDRFDVGKKEAREYAEKRVHELYNSEVEETLKGKHGELLKSDPKTDFLRADYALLPVWFLTFRYENRPFTVLVNGQTKKMVGAVPFVKAKAYAMFAGMAVVLCTVLSVLFSCANYLCGYAVANTRGNGNGVGRLIGYYVVFIIFLYGWTWVTAVKRYRHMKKCISLTCANSTNRFVKERQDR
ncbi:MAG: hypothetical protein IK055_07285 [Lachnospiraceae bacterium]|nr:hypothetical protein [Lachnospiraceae bacterium]